MAAWADAASTVSSYTHVPTTSGHSLAVTEGLPQTDTTLQGRIELFVVVKSPELRKGTTAARPAAIGVNEVYKDHQQHSYVHPVLNPFKRAEQATEASPPLYAEALDRSTSQSRVDGFGHRQLRGGMGPRTTRTGSGEGSLAQMGILRTLSPTANASRPDIPRGADELELWQCGLIVTTEG